MSECSLQKPYSRSILNNLERDNPQTPEAAFCFQWHDWLEKLYSQSNIKAKDKRRELFAATLRNFKTSIANYEDLHGLPRCNSKQE